MIGFSPEVGKRIAHFKQEDERRILRGLIISVIFLVVVVATAFSLPFRPFVSICWVVTVLGLASWLSVLASKVGNGDRVNEFYEELRLRDEFLSSSLGEEHLTNYAKLCQKYAQEQQALQQQYTDAALQDEEEISKRLGDVTARFKEVQQHFFALRGLLEKRCYRVKKGEGKADSYKLYLSLNPSTPPAASPKSPLTLPPHPFADEVIRDLAFRAGPASGKDQEHFGDPEPPI
jgi:hypothetical protein